MLRSSINLSKTERSPVVICRYLALISSSFIVIKLSLIVFDFILNGGGNYADNIPVSTTNAESLNNFNGLDLVYKASGSNHESGSKRTTLEVIQSRTILLNSRINLANSEKNFLISKFKLLSAIGRLTAQQLNLKQ